MQLWVGDYVEELPSLQGKNIVATVRRAHFQNLRPTSEGGETKSKY